MDTSVRWWDGAVIYQIYPSSFCDTNGDGVGDLPGITQKIDYIAGLGVDAIWISPFYLSPMKDFGYDVADYRVVDPRYGSNEDFDRLLARAHDAGLKVVVDMVICHTSDQHPWFRESRQDLTNAKADWYVWRDPKPDGTEPNNWLGFFGGHAWAWDHHRRQYYLCHFLDEQPNLNYYNREVRDAILDTCRFWLHKGVDGFRMDAIATLMFDPELRDNPSRSPDDPYLQGALGRMPFGRQHNFVHQLNKQPETGGFIRELRQLADEYGAFLLGEVGGDDGALITREYVGDDLLHTGYSFDLLDWDGMSPERIKKVVKHTQDLLQDNEITYASGNHDMSRVLSTWGRSAQGTEYEQDFVCMANALIVSLPGSTCIYQGEELGLENAEVPFEALQDPYGIKFYPEFPGRDGCRTPIPWVQDAPNAGFSTGKPWLPIDPRHLSKAVNVQEEHDGSTLRRVRHFLNWRRQEPAMRRGASFGLLESPADVIAGIRELDAGRMLCVFNMSAEPRQFQLPEGAWTPEADSGFTVRLTDGAVDLAPYGSAFLRGRNG